MLMVYIASAIFKGKRKVMTRKIGFLQFSIYLCLLIFLAGCNTGPNVPDFRVDESWTASEEISETLIARIYFDATLSMQGFVKPGSTHYTQILPYIERVITTGAWRDERVKFFRFGTQVKPISRDIYVKMVANPEFYGDTGINLETRIQTVIDSEVQEVINNEMENTSVEDQTGHTISDEKNNHRKKSNHLVVIVTDLFQQNSDINLLVTQLKEKYIEKGLEVGLLGLRSHFDGKVYDIGPSSASMSYKSIPEDSETFRPFYLLVLGRYADIVHYFNRFTRDFSETQTIIFSQYLVNPLISFEDVLPDQIDLTKLNKDNTFATNVQDPRLERFSIADDSAPVKISVTLEYVPLPYAMPFSTNTLQDSVIVKHAPEEGQTQEYSAAQKCLEVTSKFLKKEYKNELTVDFSLTPQCLPDQDAIYLYEVTLSPRINEYGVPDWCLVWDMGSKTQHGSKTFNLVNFVRSLSQVTAQLHHPRIAKFYFYIKKG